MPQADFFVVGGGTAAAYCASELRRRGAEGSILIATREAEPPYDRPPLSKGYLRGDEGRESAHVKALDWYEDNDVELRIRTNVMSIDPVARTAKLQGGEEVGFDKALLATGAMVNILRIEGAALEGIHYLRAFGNADAIREEARAAGRVVLVGGSFIGCEVAATLQAMGVACTIVMMEAVTFENNFGPEVGRFFQERLREQGVEVVAGETIEAFEGDARVQAVVTASGRTIEADMAVVGAGVRPDAMLAQRAGIEVRDGIVCDARLQTSAPGIFAAGDACSYDSVLHGRRLRVEHWDVALQQGRHAAGAMLGSAEPYRELPYFYSELSDWASLEAVGPASSWDETVIRGDLDGGKFSAWYLEDGRLRGAVSVERSADLIEARRLVEDATDLSGARDALADPDSDLAGIGR